MNEEIFEENNISDTVPFDDVNMLDNSVEEIEENSSISQDELVNALLQLVEDVSEEQVVETTGSGVEIQEPVPTLVQNVNENDYFDDLLLIEHQLTTIIENQETLIAYNEPHNLETYITEYSLTEFALVCGCVAALFAFGFSAIRRFCFHLK